MQFERGKDPKEAMGIGLKAKAPTIGNLFKVSIEIDYGYEMEYVSRRQTLDVVDSYDVVHILKGIANGTIPLDTFAFEQDRIIGDSPTVGNHPGIETFTDYRGKYVKYVNRVLSRMAADQYDHFNEEYIFLIP